ncbi:dienelactone hydrolase family protein [Rhizobiaceae bacterium BDR2-2]|uniref:Dienelactone hydrolase family protein n=1 Tax=Ectorhizobium quercum TaxID=2965071 RepID=A0AAE3SWL7_9HYPH|nr:dienelactone hydrolase family protein [Ectorhizobium quercum]MCX8999292.1 dienelactone hydrolase family protein [Ectorhizobium quercum]
MWFTRFILIAAFSLTASLPQAAGLKLFEVPADDNGPALRVIEWSPCVSPPEEINLGPFRLPAVRNCPISGDKLPLIVISHGFGGTFLSHHDTAESLADSGFIVVALNHPDDTASNETKARNLSALVSRPTDIKRLIDFMLGSSSSAAQIDPQRIGFYGFSRGGYTGLVLAGANPDFQELRSVCQHPTGAACDRISQAALPKAPLTHDPRIRAFVIADPLSNVFHTTDSLKAVIAPVQLWSSQRGGDGVSPENLATVARNLPVKPELHVVPNSGHFAFLTICPPELAKSVPEFCIDNAGFDRTVFHKEFNAQVLAFFREKLSGADQP